MFYTRLLALICICFSLGFIVACSSSKKSNEFLTIKNNPSDNVYRIVIYPKNVPIPRAIGTAFQIKYQGRSYLLSAYHVCTSFIDNTAIPLIEYKEDVYYSTKILKVKREYDLCLLELPSDLKNDQPITLARYNPIEGQYITAIGFPLTAFKIIAKGKYLGPIHFTEPNFEVTGQYLGTIEFLSYPGQSGGPILNQRSELIGVLILRDGEKAYFTPLHLIYRFLRENG